MFAAPRVVGAGAVPSPGLAAMEALVDQGVEFRQQGGLLSWPPHAWKEATPQQALKHLQAGHADVVEARRQDQDWVSVNSLRDLEALDGFYGRGQRAALAALESAGATFHAQTRHSRLIRKDVIERQAVGSYGAWQYLAGEDPTPELLEIHLGNEKVTLKSGEDALLCAFVHGHGDAAPLARPKLAESLKAAGQMGCTLSSGPSLDSYRLLAGAKAPATVTVSLGDATLGELPASRLENSPGFASWLLQQQGDLQALVTAVEPKPPKAGTAPTRATLRLWDILRQDGSSRPVQDRIELLTTLQASGLESPGPLHSRLLALADPSQGLSAVVQDAREVLRAMAHPEMTDEVAQVIARFGQLPVDEAARGRFLEHARDAVTCCAAFARPDEKRDSALLDRLLALPAAGAHALASLVDRQPFTPEGTWARVTLPDGNEAWDDSPHGNYPPHADMSLTGPWLDLAGLSAPRLEVSARYTTEVNYDGCAVEVRRDDDSFEQVTCFTGHQPDFARKQVDLSAYSGSKVQVRFRMFSDVSNEAEGISLRTISLAGQDSSCGEAVLRRLHDGFPPAMGQSILGDLQDRSLSGADQAARFQSMLSLADAAGTAGNGHRYWQALSAEWGKPDFPGRLGILCAMARGASVDLALETWARLAPLSPSDLEAAWHRIEGMEKVLGSMPEALTLWGDLAAHRQDADFDDRAHALLDLAHRLGTEPARSFWPRMEPLPAADRQACLATIEGMVATLHELPKALSLWEDLHEHRSQAGFADRVAALATLASRQGVEEVRALFPRLIAVGQDPLVDRVEQFEAALRLARGASGSPTTEQVLALYGRISAAGPDPAMTATLQELARHDTTWSTQGTWAQVRDADGWRTWSDSPGGPYKSNENSRITSPPLDFGKLADPHLVFTERHDLETRYDRVAVEVHEEGAETATELTSFTGTEGPRECRLDLSAVAGKRARISFHLTSDGSNEQEGIDLTRIRIEGRDKTSGAQVTVRLDDRVDDPVVQRILGMAGNPGSSLAQRNQDLATIIGLAKRLGSVHEACELWPALAPHVKDADFASQVDVLGALAQDGAVPAALETWKSLQPMVPTERSRCLDVLQRMGGELKSFPEALRLWPGLLAHHEDADFEDRALDRVHAVVLLARVHSVDHVRKAWPLLADVGHGTWVDRARQFVAAHALTTATQDDGSLEGSLQMSRQLALFQPDAEMSTRLQALASRTGTWKVDGTWAQVERADGTWEWTDSPAGNYPDNANMTMSTVLDLAGMKNCRLAFVESHHLEAKYDHVFVEASKGGGDWQALATYTGSQAQATAREIDLAAFSGDRVELRFRLQSDGSNSADGIHVTRLRVSGTDAASGEALHQNLDEHLDAALVKRLLSIAGEPGAALAQRNRNLASLATIADRVGDVATAIGIWPALAGHHQDADVAARGVALLRLRERVAPARLAMVSLQLEARGSGGFLDRVELFRAARQVTNPTQPQAEGEDAMPAYDRLCASGADATVGRALQDLLDRIPREAEIQAVPGWPPLPTREVREDGLDLACDATSPAAERAANLAFLCALPPEWACHVLQVIKAHRSEGRWGSQSLSSILGEAATYLVAGEDLQKGLEQFLRSHASDKQVKQTEKEVLIGGIRIQRRVEPEVAPPGA